MVASINKLQIKQHGRHYKGDVSKLIFFKNVFVFLYLNFTEICSHDFNKKCVSIGSGNSLVPDRRQGIVWNHVDNLH